jgi:hypothetical protein
MCPTIGCVYDGAMFTSTKTRAKENGGRNEIRIADEGSVIRVRRVVVRPTRQDSRWLERAIGSAA